MVMEIDGTGLTIEKLVKVARNGEQVALTEEAKKKVTECRGMIQELIDSGLAIYGVTTGIGEFARIKISPEQVEELQARIVHSHAAGIGGPTDAEVVRGAMLLRANTLSKGHSAIRLEVLESLVGMINNGVVPYVHKKGSVGASGDLSPLSQVAEVVMGKGYAWYDGELLDGGEAMKRAGVKTWVLQSKEGLALINGTQMFTAEGALALYDAYHLLKTAQIAASTTIDALLAPNAAYDPRVHKIRPYPGQNAVAANIRKLREGSELAEMATKVQEAYSLRCVPQVLGACRDALDWVRHMVEIEMNAGVDNPLFFPEDKEYLAAGNFHGEPVAMALDMLAISLSEIASLSERHTNRLLNPTLSGLPDFLTAERGLNSGLMVSQYTAAALVSENKVLSHPGSVDSISVSADQEDHVSMGPICSQKAREIVKNVGGVLAIQLMCAVQALDFREGKKPGKGGQIAYEEVRKLVPKLENDRSLYPDINLIADELVRTGKLPSVVEEKMGPLE